MVVLFFPTQMSKKIITFIIPIIREDEKLILKVGTSILSVTDPKQSFNYFNKTMKLEDTIEKKYVNFSQNKMLVFIKTHNFYIVLSRRTPDNKIKFRNSITFAFRKNFD